MKHSLDFHPAVGQEIRAAHDWYEQRQAGLGRVYLDEVERVVAQIAANPARYGFAERDVRVGLLGKFPYAIYYRVLTDRIRVLAVYHASRDSAGWKSRR